MRRPVDVPPARFGNGTDKHPKGKPAQDYGCPIGTPVYAPFDAVRLVRLGGEDYQGGFELRGYNSRGDFWSVQHLSEYAHGDTAAEGQVVALSGDSGTWTTGPHVHHYMQINGRRINPEDHGLFNAPAAAADPEPFTPETEEEDDMERIVYVRDQATSGQGTIYAVDRLTGRKRPVPSGEWDGIRAALNPTVTDITAARLGGIPDA